MTPQKNQIDIVFTSACSSYAATLPKNNVECDEDNAYGTIAQMIGFCHQ